MRGTAVKSQGVEEDNVSLKWEVAYLVKKENNVSDDVTHKGWKKTMSFPHKIILTVLKT